MEYSFFTVFLNDFKDDHYLVFFGPALFKAGKGFLYDLSLVEEFLFVRVALLQLCLYFGRYYCLR